MQLRFIFYLDWGRDLLLWYIIKNWKLIIYFSIANVYSIIMEVQILLDTQVELSIRRMIYEL